MPNRLIVSLLLPMSLCAAPEGLLIRAVDGTQVEGQTQLRSVKVESEGKTVDLPLSQILSIHNGAPASEFEAGRIRAGLAAIQAGGQKARDQALQTLKDTDQHEPRPLYRLFARLMPGYADGFDRTLSLVRLPNHESVRCKLPEAAVELRTADGGKATLPWSKIRSLAVRQKLTPRTIPVDSLRHCTQIEYLDTGVVLTAASKVDSVNPRIRAAVLGHR